MNRSLLVIRLDDLEFRMIETESLAPETRLPENDQTLPGGDHFLNVMKIEPAKGQRLTEGGCLRLFQGHFENFFPTAKTPHLCLDHFSAEADGLVAFLARKIRKLLPVLVASRIMGQKILDPLNAKAPQSRDPRLGDPLQFDERLGDIH